METEMFPLFAFFQDLSEMKNLFCLHSFLKIDWRIL